MGDQSSESNHASVVAHIGKDFCSDIESLFMRLMDRHMYNFLRTNEKLYEQHVSRTMAQHNLKKRTIS